MRAGLHGARDARGLRPGAHVPRQLPQSLLRARGSGQPGLRGRAHVRVQGAVGLPLTRVRLQQQLPGAVPVRTG